MTSDSNAPVVLGEPTVRMPRTLRLVLLLLPPLRAHLAAADLRYPLPPKPGDRV